MGFCCRTRAVSYHQKLRACSVTSAGQIHSQGVSGQAVVRRTWCAMGEELEIRLCAEDSIFCQNTKNVVDSFELRKRRWHRGVGLHRIRCPGRMGSARIRVMHRRLSGTWIPRKRVRDSRPLVNEHRIGYSPPTRTRTIEGLDSILVCGT